MIHFHTLRKKALQHVNDEVFAKPIPSRNYENSESVKLITKISRMINQPLN